LFIFVASTSIVGGTVKLGQERVPKAGNNPGKSPFGGFFPKRGKNRTPSKIFFDRWKSPVGINPGYFRPIRKVPKAGINPPEITPPERTLRSNGDASTVVVVVVVVVVVIITHNRNNS
jgi:hypothetical protein